MTYIETSEGRLYAESVGEGPAVLLIPGLGGRAAFWSQQIAPFAEHFRVITHDHRGAGRSDRPAITYSVQQMAKDVLYLMDSLGIDKAHAVGHSKGGAVVQQLALDTPDRLDRIVLSASWAGPTSFFKALFALRKRILVELGPEAYLLDGILRAHPAGHVAKNWAQIETTAADRLKAFAGLDIEGRRIAAVVAHDLRDRIPEIRHQALVVCAEDDQITPISFSRELA